MSNGVVVEKLSLIALARLAPFLIDNEYLILFLIVDIKGPGDLIDTTKCVAETVRKPIHPESPMRGEYIIMFKFILVQEIYVCILLNN